MKKLISFIIKSDFAFFKKPDYNDGLQLSYNILHKPALLGILGAIAGLEGYKRKGELPEYYLKLQNLLVAIKPIGDEKGNFQKTSVKYTNTVGYANLDGNLLVEETMLVKPAYLCYLLLNIDEEVQSKLYEYISNGKAEYIPYLGKNEFQAWIGNEVTTYEYDPFQAESEFKIDSMFVKEGAVQGKKAETSFSFAVGSMVNQGSFCYFERLPVGFNEKLMQYQYSHFAYTDWAFKPNSKIESLYLVKTDFQERIIQLF